MKVIRRFGNKLDHPATSPLLSEPGFWWELRAGDICHPTGKGNWFTPPYFQHAWKWYCPWPILPYLSWRVGNKGGYMGFKIYGVDSPTYVDWAGAENVYPGSQAMQVSLRPFVTFSEEEDAAVPDRQQAGS